MEIALSARDFPGMSHVSLPRCDDSARVVAEGSGRAEK